MGQYTCWLCADICRDKKRGKLCAQLSSFLSETMVYLDDCIVTALECPDLLLDPVYNIYLCHGKIVGDDQVKNQIGMGWPLHHAEVMHGKPG